MDTDTIAEAIDRLGRGLNSLKGIGAVADMPDGEILFDEWDWEIGVGLYGHFRAAEARNDTAALDALARWYDRQIARGLPSRQINSTAPMLALTLLAGTRNRPDWTPVIRDWATWLVEELPKTGEGGFEHVVKEGRNPGELWDDTLVMAGLFLGAAGRLLEVPAWVAAAQYQYLCHIRFLGDRRTGLFFHGWTFEGHHNFAGALWARGNAWLTVAIPELFRIAPPADPAMARYLAEVYRTQVAALAKVQDDSGLFPTLLDDPDAPLEASATAGIAYGILAGQREGLIGAGYDTLVARAAQGILARIGDDGILQDVSDGTPMGHTLDFYRQIPNTAAPYGQALALLFLGALGDSFAA